MIQNLKCGVSTIISDDNKMKTLYKTFLTVFRPPLLAIILTANFGLCSNAQSLQWAKAMGTMENEYGLSIATDNAGNIYSTGYFSGTADFDPGTGTFDLISAGSTDVFVSKLDASGNFLWAKAIGGSGGDGGNSISTDSAGNLYITGYFNATADFDPGAGTVTYTSAGDGDVFITKLDASGNLLWAKAIGGTGNDWGISIATDIAGKVYTTGHFYGTADFDPGAGILNLTSAGNIDVFVSKLDASGNFLWAKAIGGTGSDIGFSIATDGAGNVYTTGYFNATADFDPGTNTFNLTSEDDNDIFISKLDASGNFLWAKKMGGKGGDRGYSIAIDGAGNVYTTGYFNATADFDPGTETFNLTSEDDNDIFISKLDAFGNFLWARAMGGLSGDGGNSIATDGAGNVYTTGYFKNTVDFDPGEGIFNLISAGGNDIFISKLDASGNFLWAGAIGGASNDMGNSITTDSAGNVYTTGYFRGAIDFDIQAGTFILPSSGGSQDIFVCKLGSFTTGIYEPSTIAPQLTIYPNPFSALTTLQTLTPLNNATLIVVDIFGQTVAQINNINDRSITFNRDNLPSGMYFIRLTQNGQVIATNKIIINN